MARKAQNSILLLTTLGVYIGLLVTGGAAPQVLAHSATTRNFEITDEIEVKDDLDKDPGERGLVDPKRIFEDKFAEFALAYSRFTIEDYVLAKEHEPKLRAQCPTGCRLSYLSYFASFDDLDDILGVKGFSRQIQRAEDLTTIQFEVGYTPSNEELQQFGSAFSAVPKEFKARWSPTTELVRTNSTVTKNFKNGHLVVVTRLPRGSLDALLAKYAK